MVLLSQKYLAKIKYKQMKIKLYLSIAFMLCGTAVFAQINIGGKPYSFDNKNLQNSPGILPFYETSSPDLQAVRQEDSINDARKDAPWRFGIKFSVDLSPENSGLVQNLKDGGKLWRIGIRCPNAKSVNLIFSKFKIPKGAKLYLYNSDKKTILGGFTEQNNQKDSLFATGIVLGDNLIVEYYEPKDVENKGILQISTITYGYRGIDEYSKDFGESGDCNMNAACPDGLSWNEQIRSVCMITVNGSGFCSGSLINNTIDNGTPYILTANHCYTSSASTWVFWFNWQSSGCENPTESPAHQDLSGAVLRAKDYISDFCLVEMNHIPPPQYNVYYAGWDKSGNQPETEICVHHPQGDIKKISFNDDPAISAEYELKKSTGASHWKIPVWDRNTTTEAGSSGSPLFDQNGRIVGQLHGGYASCTVWAADYFGKFSVSWNNGLTADTRLNDWLDPLNINPDSWNGYDPNLPILNFDAEVLSINNPSGEYFTDSTITPQISIRNKGLMNISSLSIKYYIDDKLPVTIVIENPIMSKEIVETTFPKINITPGQHTLTAEVIINGETDENPSNNILIKNFAVYQTVFKDNFETDTGWTLGGEFQIGLPFGLGGSSGFRDPYQSETEGNILGTDLSGTGDFPGDYEPHLTDDEYFAVSPPINCSSIKDAVLIFDRILNIGNADFDKASIQINTGLGWIPVWENSNEINEDVWTRQILDISEYADHHDFVLIRFTLGPSNDMYQFSGWNIDNLELAGVIDRENTAPLSGFLLFPNPNKGEFTIVNNLNISDLDISIYNLSGALIYENKFKNSREAQISCKSLPKGLYIAKLQTAQGNKYFKFEIQ